MQLSCLPVSLYADFNSGQRTLGDWFRLAHDLGLDGADISVAHVKSRDSAYLDALRGEATDAGVTLMMMVTYSDFTHPDAAERARQVDDIRSWIEVADRLGLSFLRLTAGQNHPSVEEATGLAWASKGLMACLGDARAAGVGLLYENHTRGAFWTMNDFTQPAARFLDVVRRTSGSDLRLLFDTANNLALNDDPIAVLSAVKSRVAAIHLADIRRPGAFEPVVIGTGSSPITEIFRIMLNQGFDGLISIEEASRTGEEGFRQAVEFADRAWVEAGGKTREKHSKK